MHVAALGVLVIVAAVFAGVVLHRAARGVRRMVRRAHPGMNEGG